LARATELPVIAKQVKPASAMPSESRAATEAEIIPRITM
jgi:hypothetical protein